MALSNTLVTNEIKNAAGTEIEFQRLTFGDGRAEFAKLAESPGFPHRMSISHQESGSGVTQRRRSVIRFDYTATGAIDSTQKVKDSCYVVLDRNIGNVTTDDNAKLVLANLMSFLASLGANTTILYDCTGTGASNLISRGI